MTGFPKGGTKIRQFGCVYLEREEDTTTCLIFSGAFPLEELPENARKWFLTNCKNYPNPEDSGCVPPRHILYPGCTYRMIKRELNAFSD